MLLDRHIQTAVRCFVLISIVNMQLCLQWLKLTSDDVKEQIYKLAKEGLTPSQIGEDFLLV